MELIVLALATWRMASLLSNEDGPWDMLAKLRHLVGVRPDERGVPYGTNTLAKGILCGWCSSVWIGLLWAVLYYLWPCVWWLALPLALSAGAIVVDRVT